MLSQELRQKRFDVLVSVLGPVGILNIWSGEVPASIDVPTTPDNLLLVSTPGRVRVTGLRADLDLDIVVGRKVGLASFFRIHSSRGMPVFQGRVGTGLLLSDPLITKDKEIFISDCCIRDE